MNSDSNLDLKQITIRIGGRSNINHVKVVGILELLNELEGVSLLS